MSAVHHLQLPGLRVAGDHGGDEVVAAEVAREAPLDPVDDGEEIRLVVGGLAEDAEHQRGRPHGRQSLAAHIADDQPHSVRGGYQRVEIPADTGLGRRGAVADGHLERADGRRYGREQRVLGGLRDRADGGEHPVTAPAQRAGQATRQVTAASADSTAASSRPGTPSRAPSAAPSTAARTPTQTTPRGPFVVAASAGPAARSGSQTIPAPPTRSASTTTETISTGSACSTGIPTAGRAVARPRARRSEIGDAVPGFPHGPVIECPYMPVVELRMDQWVPP